MSVLMDMQLIELAARLAASTGEPAVTVAEKFADWLAQNPESIAALSAAVTEGANRHVNLRVRTPVSSETVIALADEFVAFLGARQSQTATASAIVSAEGFGTARRSS